MECMYCKGKMERGAAPFHIDRNGYHLVFDKVLAFVCQQCGEVYFEEPQFEPSMFKPKELRPFEIEI